MIDYIEKAKAFAMMAHKGQTDKAGEDYFTAHVAVVADGVEPDPLVKAAAYLHDTVEDTGTTIDTIRAEFPQEVAEAVSVLTRKKDMTYAEYIWRVKQRVNPRLASSNLALCAICSCGRVADGSGPENRR